MLHIPAEDMKWNQRGSHLLVYESEKKSDRLLLISGAKQKVCLFMGNDLINISEQVKCCPWPEHHKIIRFGY